MRSPAGVRVEVEAGLSPSAMPNGASNAERGDGLGAERGELGGHHPADATRRSTGQGSAPVASIASQNVVSQSR